MRPWVRRSIGIALILVAIPGLFLPILQFWVLLIPGVLLLLGPRHRASVWMLARVRRARAWVRAKRMAYKARRRGVCPPQFRPPEAREEAMQSAPEDPPEGKAA